MDKQKINEGRLKHFEMIQAVIMRMSSNAFLIKGWTISLVAALLAIAIQYNNKYIPIITFFIIIAFWYLDYYFLSLERKYREFWNEKTQEPQDSPTDFSMDITKYNSKCFTIFFRPINLVFYGILCILTISSFIMLSYLVFPNV